MAIGASFMPVLAILGLYAMFGLHIERPADYG